MPNDPLLDEGQRQFLAAARSATLATIAPTGRPRLVPICFVIQPAGPDGLPRLHSPLDEKPKRSDDPHDLARVRDILGDPEVTLLVDRWSESWARLAWLRLEARAALLEPGTGDSAEHAIAVAALRAKYPQYAGHRLDERPMLRFTIKRVVAWGALDGE
jgi:PPOX class probable F420-dependent enzyme